MGLYGWAPADVWQLPLSEALRYERARLRVAAIGAQILGLVLTAPFATGSQAARIRATLDRLTAPDGPPQTLAERYGLTVAREVAELEGRQREWLERKRKELKG